MNSDAWLSQIGVRHGLWAPDAAVETLWHGTENNTYLVSGYIVRQSADREAVDREVALLTALATASATAVPAPIVHEPESGLFVYRQLPGSPLLLQSRRPDKHVVPAVAEALRALRSISPELRLPVDDYPTERWHLDAVRHYEAVRSQLDPLQASAVERFLADEPPPSRRDTVPAHNDLGAEHILVDDRGRVTGIIDWTDAALADPACDPGTVFRDFGSGAALRLLDALGRTVTDDEVSRIRFFARCSWLEDFAYALEDPAGREPYLVNARHTFGHTFGS